MNTANTNIQALKEQLDSELKKVNSDNDLILSLSHQIANFDKNRVRFSVDAGLINRLGKELVGRHETAVAELVKNAYDADATSVNLFFDNSDSVGGTLLIEDNGAGMNRQQLIDGFMTISSSDKIHNPNSLRYKRTRAGQKGIGRFAAQRLGSRLIVTTQTKEWENALKVTIEWDKFASDSNLLLISNAIEEVDKTREEGTTLLIENLRDTWSIAMVQRAYRYISDLLQPFPLSMSFEENEGDPGFKASFYKENEEIASEKNIFFKNAVAEIEACVDNIGNGFYSLKSQHFDLEDDLYPIGSNEKNEKYEKFSDLRNINLKAFYFIYRVGLIPKQIESAIRQNADEYGGIRLYRNGFRVLPYAEKDNDWLGLDASVRKNAVITPHGNNNFYGFIEVIDKKGEIFQELSSREGLLENIAFNELKDFAYKVLVDATLKISSLRGRKTHTSQEGWEKKSHNILEEAVARLEEEVDKSENNENNLNNETFTPPQPSFSTNDLKDIAQNLREGLNINGVEKEKLLQEIQLLRILASLGLTIGEFVHEVKHHLRAFDLDIDFLHRKLSEEIFSKRTIRLKSNLNSFTTYTSYFDKTISENINRESAPVELKDAVHSFYKIVNSDALRSGINMVSPEFIGYDLYTCPMHMSEWASILFNFYTNSKKAIKRAETNGLIKVKAGSVDDKVYLEFSDNGDGIPQDKHERIFDVFFTTSFPSGKKATEIEEITGTGLGLKIVKDTVEGYGGEVFVTSPEKGYSATIRIEIPQTEIR